ncbi:Nif3-like dinuclear metal center hexameric protein [Jonesia quinghaiensis]|uniref:Nif3-like dinuclear metal center hexameric protein n=1 Tax=Jonesia quinghaiensis TaxID=262806 RepID=UPI000417A503|nr:Nif3-like dinuclear metal center hexameric protein [Jonesia quinghaiensis]
MNSGNQSDATLGQVIEVLEDLYPIRLAEDWDHVGLAVGDRSAPVRRICFAVDATYATITEALDWGADLIVTHHPFLFSAVHSVSTDTDRGHIIHQLIAGGCALYTAHTNADSAQGGVNDALADLIGLQDTTPLVPDSQDPTCGLGRVGKLEHSLSLRDLAQRLADAIPVTAQGVRVAGDLGARVSTVAVLGGSGASLLDAAVNANPDVYITSDFKHHDALDAREAAHHRSATAAGIGQTPYLIDTAHYASEWPWLPVAASAVKTAMEQRGYSMDTWVSTLRTDPWTARVQPKGGTA